MDSLLLREAPFLLIIAIALGLAVSLCMRSMSYMLISAVLAAILFFLYRAPSRSPPTSPGAVVSPVDGTLLEVRESDGSYEFVFFVHELDPQVQWMPYPGVIKSVRTEGAGVTTNWLQYDMYRVANNERVTTVIGTTKGDFTIEQIKSLGSFQSDVFPEVSESLDRSGHMGYIMFPARIDLKVPKPLAVKAHVGQETTGGETVIAEFDSE